jgi:hypothetical protein
MILLCFQAHGACICFCFFGPDPIPWSQSLRLQEVKSPTAGIDRVGNGRGKVIGVARSDYVDPCAILVTVSAP